MFIKAVNPDMFDAICYIISQLDKGKVIGVGPNCFRNSEVSSEDSLHFFTTQKFYGMYSFWLRLFLIIFSCLCT